MPNGSISDCILSELAKEILYHLQPAWGEFVLILAVAYGL